MKIVTRMEAAKAGLVRYYTGRKCKRGHDAERFTSTGICVVCNRENASSHRQHMKEVIAEGRAA